MSNLLDALSELPDISAPLSVDSIQHVSVNAEQARDLCQKSVDYLAAVALPEVFKYNFPPLYLSAWNWLLSFVHKPRDFSQLALGLPRGFAKTTFVKIFCLYVILFTDRKFILIMSENVGKAVNIIADVCDMLSHSNIVALFGDWRISMEKDTQELKKFGFRKRNIVLMAGTVETVRGINLKNERPDIMIFDDIQSRECAESQLQSETLEREMIGTAMKAKSPHGCLFIFIGNMYPTKWSILKHLKASQNWVKFIVGGILEDGTSLWEELQPIEQLLREFENDCAMGHPEIFFAEVLNDENASANNIIDLQKIGPCPYKEDDIPECKVVIIDPAGDKAESDLSAIGRFDYFDGKAVSREIIHERLSPLETIRKAITMCLTHGVSLIAIESNAYQGSLVFWFNYICRQMQISGIQCVEVHSGSAAKNSRILGMLKSYAAKEIYTDDATRAIVHAQIVSYRPNKRDNVDGILDLMTYAPKVYELYSDYMLSMNIINHQEFSHARVIEHNSPF